jgi:CheY-like chemotaxis protein
MSTVRIMVIDDNESNLKLVRDLLEMAGFEVCSCIHAEDALHVLEKLHPDLILMDLALPGIDGLQLTRKLKGDATTRGITIVALTASAMKGDRERILAAGCDGYMTKPIDTRKFVSEVAKFLEADE